MLPVSGRLPHWLPAPWDRSQGTQSRFLTGEFSSNPSSFLPKKGYAEVRSTKSPAPTGRGSSRLCPSGSGIGYGHPAPRPGRPDQPDTVWPRRGRSRAAPAGGWQRRWTPCVPWRRHQQGPCKPPGGRRAIVDYVVAPFRSGASQGLSWPPTGFQAGGLACAILLPPTDRPQAHRPGRGVRRVRGAAEGGIASAADPSWSTAGCTGASSAGRSFRVVGLEGMVGV
jgi:hypothetical protein